MRAISSGWEFQVPGLAGRTELRVNEAAEISLNQKAINPELPARDLYKSVNDALILKPTRAASSFLDAFIPRAEANPVVILPALATLGLVAAVQAIARYTSGAPAVVLERYFKDAQGICEKEKSAKRGFEKSQTSATFEKIKAAGIVRAPSKAGDCEVFAGNFKHAQKEKLLVGNANRACQAADSFLLCAANLRAGRKTRNSLPPAGATQMDVE